MDSAKAKAWAEVAEATKLLLAVTPSTRSSPPTRPIPRLTFPRPLELVRDELGCMGLSASATRFILATFQELFDAMCRTAQHEFAKTISGIRTSFESEADLVEMENTLASAYSLLVSDAALNLRLKLLAEVTAHKNRLLQWTPATAPSENDVRGAFTPKATKVLWSVYEKKPRISTAEKRSLANATGLSEHQVAVWFANQRSRKGNSATRPPLSSIPNPSPRTSSLRKLSAKRTVSSSSTDTTSSSSSFAPVLPPLAFPHGHLSLTTPISLPLGKFQSPGSYNLPPIIGSDPFDSASTFSDEGMWEPAEMNIGGGATKMSQALSYDFSDEESSSSGDLLPWDNNSPPSYSEPPTPHHGVQRAPTPQTFSPEPVFSATNATDATFLSPSQPYSLLDPQYATNTTLFQSTQSAHSPSSTSSTSSPPRTSAQPLFDTLTPSSYTASSPNFFASPASHSSEAPSFSSPSSFGGSLHDSSHATSAAAPFLTGFDFGLNLSEGYWRDLLEKSELDLGLDFGFGSGSGTGAGTGMGLEGLGFEGGALEIEFDLPVGMGEERKGKWSLGSTGEAWGEVIGGEVDTDMGEAGRDV